MIRPLDPEEVLRRHESIRLPDTGYREECSVCEQYWPCDTAQLARQLLETRSLLETIYEQVPVGCLSEDMMERIEAIVEPIYRALAKPLDLTGGQKEKS